MKIKNYEPKLNFIFQEKTEVNVNMTIEELLMNINPINAIDVIEIMHRLYFVSYKGIAHVMGISASTLRVALTYGSFTYVLRNEKLQEGLLSLQLHFTKDTFVEDIEEVE